MNYFVCVKTKDGHFITFSQDFSGKDFTTKEEAGRFGWEYFTKYHGNPENLEYVVVSPYGSDDVWFYHRSVEEAMEG